MTGGPVDHLAAAGVAAQERLELLAECLFRELEGDEDDTIPWPEDMAAPYDGCTTCDVREALHAAYPHIRRHVLEEDCPKPDIA